MILSEIDIVDDISKEVFLEKYFKAQKPVLIKGFAKKWEAYEKWNLDYIYDQAGEQVVGLYDNKPADPNKATDEPVTHMKMRDYIRLIKTQPSDLRIFFYIITDKLPELLKNFSYPDLGFKYFKRIPTLFFGGSEARVLMHYDVDLGDLLHFQFEGKKRVLLFPPEEAAFLYKVPLSVHTIYNVDYERPDYTQFPALRYAKGYEIFMEHGDALFMPSGYWHFNRYLEAGFSITLRSFPSSSKRLLNMLNEVFFIRYTDKLMRKLFKQKWVNYKQRKAFERSQKALNAYLKQSNP
ncbi:cupin-like domain-containing protein [Sphingobacterium chuzhouense]|uniref:Cupin-like domain-containing protein n=1 Tax=Sphingobacterium chuzhouense TaxID=1742264 RepID=A0ABR7XV83_9SPHI|nr:cupin-like domain-containing protein [Sphingobacterium chuzhouense]MBD1422965.1 cupin-like domain-containing protein [Sphingobacterium chuzhouense]